MRHRHYLCSLLALKSGLTVLNVGSGVGDTAIELARYADVCVVGVDSNSANVRLATIRVQEAGLSHKISFIHTDLQGLLQWFPAQSFDVIYGIDSLKAVHSLESVYSTLATLLKPGGKIGIVDWCWTSQFNPSNQDHRRLAEAIEYSCRLPARAPEERSMVAARAALEGAGMIVRSCEDLAARHDAIPWYAPLEAAISDAAAPWAENPEEGCALFGGLTKNAAAVILQAAKWKLFTPMAVFIAMKAA
ncbi:S-adenosyl-L-methionine-dependent methyltransferase [Phanerochaete sordida]|uniref:S-adenosyl-L-methionine-dependent methyltransferase n=1 Tax=Phanerochaete sordida TaxID=48140 RepID=A0A9P3GDG3_9APHY|nr:S-adenosyl-L-methionine-dependent methyltransferase [Phanerochaete sordida]